MFLREYLSTALVAEGMDGSQVSTILDGLDQTMRHEYGGDDHYIPAIDKKRRNNALVADWKEGVQIPALAKRYSLHVGSVYRILRQKPCGSGLGTEEWLL